MSIEISSDPFLSVTCEHEKNGRFMPIPMLSIWSHDHDYSDGFLSQCSHYPQEWHGYTLMDFLAPDIKYIPKIGALTVSVCTST